MTGIRISLAILSVVLLGTSSPAVASQATPHTVHLPLAQNPLLDDTLIWATVVSVADGDTISVNIDGCPIECVKLRLIGIDTPERGECFWADARDRTRELVLGQRVVLQRDISEYDSWNRLLRHVYLADETWVNAVLVTEGWARVTTYEPDDRYAGALSAI